MILCRSLNLIFVKTKKVGGTSFEIALSKYCDSGDIVTPVSTDDELTRTQLGYQGPANYLESDRCESLRDSGVRGDFVNHMSCEKIHANLEDSAFDSFTKISIQRDPLDFLISQYFWRISRKSVLGRLLKPSFKRWLAENHTNVLSNYQIAPTNGRFAPDITMNYESLHQDIVKTGLFPNDFIATFEGINAKGNLRGTESRDSKKFFQDQGCFDFVPKIEELIAAQVS